jgi:hypothetical protein
MISMPYVEHTKKSNSMTYVGHTIFLVCPIYVILINFSILNIEYTKINSFEPAQTDFCIVHIVLVHPGWEVVLSMLHVGFNLTVTVTSYPYSFHSFIALSHQFFPYPPPSPIIYLRHLQKFPPSAVLINM